jgi:3'-5' exoribonuclease
MKSTVNKEALFDSLKKYIFEIRHPWLKGMVEAVLHSYAKEFCNAPAARSKHHAYPGGLLEHTCSVVKTAKFLYEQHPKYAELDLILAGAILHDLGKIKSYTWDGDKIVHSSSEELIHHIPLGMMMLKPFLDQFEIDPKKQEAILHILASHHGIREWGSPVEPATKEATIVHLADLADARLTRITGLLNE